MGFESSPENYTVGRGQGYFNKKDNAGVYTGMRNLGNIKSLSTSVGIEKQPHFSTKAKYRSKDKEAIIEISPKIKITLDEINAENFAMLFLASVTEVDQLVAAVAPITVLDVKRGYVSDLGVRFINPTGFTVTNEGAVKTYVRGVDYAIDFRTGKLSILLAGSIVEGEDLTVNAALLAQKYKMLNAFSENAIEGEFFYASDNAAGSNQQITYWNVSLTPTGDTILVTEGSDWSTIELEGEVLSMPEKDAEFPFGRIVIID
jgi:hypothetical protein